MKKIIALLAVVGMFSLQGCTSSVSPAGIVNNNFLSTVYETTSVNFLPTGYSINYTFPMAIYPSDVVLVYRLSGAVNGNDLWEFLPENHYFVDGTRNFSYNFNFTRNDVQIYLEGNNLSTLDPAYRLNQIFRIVVVPGSLATTLNTKDYVGVMAALKLNENQIQKINF